MADATRHGGEWGSALHGRRPVVEVVDEDVAKILAAKTGAQRLEIAFGLWRLARQLTMGSVRSLHPGWDEERVAAETARRLTHGPD